MLPVASIEAIYDNSRGTVPFEMHGHLPNSSGVTLDAEEQADDRDTAGPGDVHYTRGFDDSQRDPVPSQEAHY
jgi:hypothetical protein